MSHCTFDHVCWHGNFHSLNFIWNKTVALVLLPSLLLNSYSVVVKPLRSKTASVCLAVLGCRGKGRKGCDHRTPAEPHQPLPSSCRAHTKTDLTISSLGVFFIVQLLNWDVQTKCWRVWGSLWTKGSGTGVAEGWGEEIQVRSPMITQEIKLLFSLVP